MQSRETTSDRGLLGLAARCLVEQDPDLKIRGTWQLARRLEAGEPLGLHSPERPLGPPGLPSALRLVSPLSVPKRKLGSAAGRAAFVHAIAHIELNAVNLALDCLCRFSDMPPAFYRDWASVADDEATHFCLLRERLRELGADYGDFEAHNGLWEMAEKTADDVLARMAMVPRVLEARGLDVTPALIARLQKAGDVHTAAILEIVLEEEVAHVATGTRWFRHECARRRLDPDATFRELVRTHAGGLAAGKLNREHRRRAGFTEAEMDALENG